MSILPNRIERSRGSTSNLHNHFKICKHKPDTVSKKLTQPIKQYIRTYNDRLTKETIAIIMTNSAKSMLDNEYFQDAYYPKLHKHNFDEISLKLYADLKTKILTKIHNKPITIAFDQ